MVEITILALHEAVLENGAGSIHIILNRESDSHRHRAVCKREVRAGQQGRRDEARAMLAEIYNRFSEGFRHTRSQRL
jgi:hypothetical protein